MFLAAPARLALLPLVGAKTVFLIKEEEKIQRLVYYISKVLIEAETRYLKIEKLAMP